MIPKFRAWYKKNTLPMLCVSLISFDQKFIDACIDKELKAETEMSFDLDDVVLMQSTGLFDTSYQDELFEDDVILWTYFDEWSDSGKARIVYRDGCWKTVDVKTSKEVWDSLFDCLENCNVYLAGNIYENPELLETNND